MNPRFPVSNVSKGDLPLRRQQSFLGFIDPRRKEGAAPEIGMHPLHQTAMGLPNVRRTGSRFKTKDLVGLLLAHGARSWRATLPLATIRLAVFTPDGKSAVKVRLQ